MSAFVKAVGIIVFLSGAACGSIRAQGCSDAGFCTAGALQGAAPKPGSKVDLPNSIAFSFTAGSGEQGTAIYMPQLEWREAIGKKSVLELKLPFYIANGNLGAHSGLGDPVLTYTHTLKQDKSWSLQATGGLRVSTGDASATGKNGLALPMPYQANLGTTDVILGLAFHYGRYLTFAAGYQQPVIQYNQNGYVPVDAGPAIPHYGDYFLSAQLRRKGDVLLRAEGHYQWHKLSVSAGPLLIYHLGKDHARISATEIRIDGSEGLTLNIAGNIAWTSRRWKADISAGTPLAVRSYRPDGLTRAWVLTPRISYLFK
jgi:hypothetical protein